MSPEGLGTAAWLAIALQIAAPAIAGSACLRAARRSEDARRGWVLLAVFSLTWALAGVVWMAEILGSGGAEIAYPSMSDVLYLVGSAPMLAGVVAFPSPTSALLPRRRLVLDVAVLTAAMTAITWMVLVRGTTPDVLLGIADPYIPLLWITFDSLVIAVVLVHGMRERSGRRLAWTSLAAGLIAISTANSVYYWLLTIDAYEAGHPVDWAWVGGFVLIALGAARWPARGELREVRTPALTRSQEAVPYATLVAAVLVAALVRPRLDGVLLGVWVAVGIAAVARRIVLMFDHVRVTNDLQRRASQQRAVAALAQAAVSGMEHTELGRLLHRACELVAEALEVPLAKVDEVQDDGDLIVIAGVGWEPDVVGKVRLPGEPSWRSGYALRLGRPITSEDAPDDGTFAVAPVLARHDVVSGVSVPIGGRTTPYGVLSVHTRVTRRFHPEEVELLQFVADVIGTALERAEADRRRASAESELQQLTGRLQAAVRMYSLALESGGMGVWEYDVAEDRLTPSRKVAEFYGPRGTSSRSFADACADVHPDDRELVWRTFHDALQSGQRFTCQYRFVRPDGAVMWVQDHARIERDERGQAHRVYGVTTDVTESKRAEEELQLRDRHLRQAQKMESLGQLAGGVAHDFNNLLTAILGNVELVETRVAPAALSELGEVRTAAQRAKGLVQQLLAFSRLQPHSRTVLDLDDVIEDLSDLLVRLIGSHIDVRVTTASRPMWVLGDHVQLQQVILNLATNARDAMPTGGVLEIATELDDEAGSVRLLVRDSGDGMPPEVLARAFEPFYTTKPEGKGTGMGLAVVYGVVVQNDGDIEVTSEPGAGTTVVVTLPYVADGPAEEIDQPERTDAPVRAGGGDGAPAPPVVLAVEDQPQIRSLITTVLESRGHSVHAAGDGIEALEVAATLRGGIDLLITDVVMPRLNGPDLAARLRATQADLKVLYISGYTRDVVLDSSRPGSAFLQKPFSIGELLEVVENLLGEGTVPPPGGGAGAPQPSA